MSVDGKVSQIIGAVLDVLFEDGHLPAILNSLEVDRGEEGTLILETALHSGDGVSVQSQWIQRMDSYGDIK